MAEYESQRKKPGRQKPPIWAEGRQAPKFDTSAFLRAATAKARGLAVYHLETASQAVRHAAAALRDGTWRFPPERLGRTGQFLPDHRRMAQTFAATARLTAAAGIWVAGPAPVRQLDFDAWQGETAANEPAAPPALSPLRYVRPPRGGNAVHAIEVDDETLATIRSAVHSANVMPIRPQRVPAPGLDPEPPEPEPRAARLPALEPAEPSPPSRAFRLGTTALGALTLAILWPAGAVMALAAHLRGEDLRDHFTA